MDVNNLNANNPLDRRVRGADTRQVRDSGAPAADGRQPTEAAHEQRQGEVRLSPQARQLRDIESQVAEQDAFDAKRVEDIRVAIAEGRYHVDPERLAARFLELELQLNQ